MIKNYLLKTLFIGLFLVFTSQSKAQIFSATSVSLNSYSGDTCSIFAATVNTYLGCINFTQGGVSKSLSGNTLTIAVNYISSPICAGAISNPIFNTNVRRIPPGTYTVEAEAYIDNTYVNTVTASSSLTIGVCTVTGVEENSELSFEVFPNPASEYITISQVSNEQISYRILDLKGSEVINGNLQNTDKVDVSKLVPGVYFLHVISDTKSSIKKLIVE